MRVCQFRHARAQPSIILQNFKKVNHFKFKIQNTKS